MQTSSYVDPYTNWANVIDGRLLSIRPITKQQCEKVVEVCPCEYAEMQKCCETIKKETETVNTEITTEQCKCENNYGSINETIMETNTIKEEVVVEEKTPKKQKTSAKTSRKGNASQQLETEVTESKKTVKRSRKTKSTK